MLAMLFFQIMIGEVGVVSWRNEFAAFKEDKAEVEQLNELSVEELVAYETDRKLQMSKRLAAVTSTMRNKELLTYICLDNVALAAVDGFLFHIQHTDSEATHGAAVTPIVYQWFDPFGPLDEAQRALFGYLGEPLKHGVRWSKIGEFFFGPAN